MRLSQFILLGKDVCWLHSTLLTQGLKLIKVGGRTMATRGEILVAKRKKVSLKLSGKSCLLTTNFVSNLC